MLRTVLHVCLLLLLFAHPSHAEPVPFEEGRLTLQFGPLYGLEVPASEASAATGIAEVQATAGGAITRIEFPTRVFLATGISIPFDDATEMAYMPPIGGVQLTFANEAGSFARIASGDPLQGAMPLAGVHRFCIFFVACGAMPSANVSVPLSVIGKGGLTTAMFVPSVTLGGETWSTGSATLDGFGSATEMIAGTVQAGSSGTFVRLVTPVFLSTNTTGTYPTTRGVGVLSFVLKPVPEPALDAALAVAVAALAGMGWRRARASRTAETGLTS